MEPLDRQLYWLIAVRLIVVTSVVVPFFFFDNFLPTTLDIPEVITLPGAGEGATPDTEDPEAATVAEPGEPAGSVSPAEDEADTDTESDSESESSEPGGPDEGGAPGAEATAPVEAPAPVERPAPAEPSEAEAAPEASPQVVLGPTTVLITERRTSGLTPRLIYNAAGLIYLASLLYIVLLRLAPRRRKLNAYVQFVGDVVMVTALVYFTGGITSPFSLFYLVIIAAAAALLRRQGGFVVATLSYVFYATTLMAIYYGRLPLPEAQQVQDDPTFRLTYNLVVHFVGFYAVAALTSLLAQRVRLAERELEDKLERLADLQVVHRDVIQSISSGLATADLEGRITSLNRAGEEILGRSEEEILGRPATDLVGADRWDELTAGGQRGQAGGDGDGTARRAPGGRGSGPPDIATNRSETRLTRDGEELYLGFTLSPLTDAAGERRGWNMVFQDLTQWRALEEKVRINDRMAAVGELAAGIAHEIGNPLAAISGSAQMLSRSVAGDAQQEKLLRILVNESQRLDRTIKGFLRFARPRDRSASRFDIARLLSEHFELLKNSPEVAPHHHLELHLHPASYTLVADPDQVSQVFWNLARNALKAMPEGGELSIGGEGDADGYRLIFRDTGRGMSEEERANLFHPFQSSFDSGSGIGMAIVYRIVQDHGGDAQVESAPGRGTTITIELPAHPRWAPGSVAQPAAEAAAGGPLVDGEKGTP